MSGPTRPLLYHHSRAIEHVRFGPVHPVSPWTPGVPDGDHRHYAIAYAWMAERCGFWPVWLAVGETEDDLRLTGYSGQWLRPATTRAARGDPGQVRRGAFPSYVLFSFADAPPGVVHSDYLNWHIVLNAVDYPDGRPAQLRSIGPRTEASILRRSWTPARWRREAGRRPGSVQAVAPALDLAGADAVWCRSQAARRALVAMGFAPERVLVRRIAVDPW